MCHFITGTLPPGADADALRTIAKRFGRGWEPLVDSTIARKLRPGETYYLTTQGMCDCGSALGSRRGQQAGEHDTARARRNKRRGWSAAKIARALASHEAARARELETEAQDAARWLGFLHAVTGSGLAASVGLLLHFYDGGVEEAEFDFERERCSLAKTDALALMTMEEDRLYEFVP